MSEEKTRVHYTGKSPIEIRVGEFHRKFRPDQVAEVKDARFRADLLERPDFKSTELETRPGKTKSHAPAKKTEKPAAEKAPAASAPAEAVPPASADQDEDEQPTPATPAAVDTEVENNG